MTAGHPGRAPVLRAEAIGKRFGQTQVLDDVSLVMERGEFLVLVGPSGCGKSTLLNCIAGLETISSGRLEIAGRDVTEVPPKDRDIAMVFQSYALYPTMTVAENIGFGMRVRGVPPGARAARVAEVAGLLQIDQLLARKPAELSGGQRQRVAMGRALVREPALFLFDEPLSNLDAKLRVEMRSEIRRLHRRTGASIVYVTHDQVEAMTLASRIAVLKAGRLQQVGTPAEIYDRPANTFVADFMGAPPMNLVPATVLDGTAVAGPWRVRAPIAAGPIVLGVRPEAVRPDQAGFALEPIMVENTGAEAFVTLDLDGSALVARVPGRLPDEPGEPLPVAIPEGAVHFFDAESGARL